MGLGDQLIATGMARGAAANGKRIAFGDQRRIIWDGNSPQIFKGNPNIAPPGSEGAPDIEWIAYYKGQRVYNHHEPGTNRWIWNYDFHPIPGEMYFDAQEQAFADALTPGFVLIEPNVPWWKPVAPNKNWGLKNFQAVADKMLADGHDVAQFSFGHVKLSGVRIIQSPTFRHALAALSRAKLAIVPEGGIHHGAAAVNVPAVVLFGGFIPPKVTGYPSHINLTGGAEACGIFTPCQHCTEAMARISVDEVLQAAKELNG